MKTLLNTKKEIKNKELDSEIEVDKIKEDKIKEDKKAQKKDIRRFNAFKKLTLTKVLKSTSARDVVAITEFIKGLCQGLNIDRERMNKARIEVLASFCSLQNDKLESKGILEILTERFENS